MNRSSQYSLLNMGKELLPLVPIILFYLGATIAHAFWVPMGKTGYQDAPDEMAHVRYVRMLQQGHLPTVWDWQQDPTKLNYEWHQPPLYYVCAVPFSLGGYRVIRFFSILCGLCVILITYWAARLLFPNFSGIAWLSSGFVGLLPGHIMLTSVVNNDPLLEVWFSWCMLLLIEIILNGLTWSRTVWIGISIGSALLTKVSGALLIPIFLVSLTLARSREETRQNLLSKVALTLGIVCLVAGWWYLRNWHLYHELFPWREFQQTFQGTAQASRMANRLGGWGNYWTTSLWLSFMSFWAVFGTPLLATKGIPAFLPMPCYYLVALITLIVLYGLLRLHFKRKQFFTSQQCRAVLLMVLVVICVLFAFLLFLTHYFQVQGRYLYPAILPIGVLVALGWQGAFAEKYRITAGVLLLTVLALLTTILLAAVQAANT